MKPGFMIYTLMFFLTLLGASCEKETFNQPDPIKIPEPEKPVTGYKIDLSNWKITLPVDQNNDNSPDEYGPSQLKDFGYRNVSALKPFLYDDFTDSSLVFYTYPGGATTTNSSYPRTELREQMTPGSNSNNWTLAQGGTMEGVLKIDDISKDNSTSSYENSRVIVMQIHGIVSPGDVTKYNLSSNHAPPLLKMTWVDGHLIAYKKSLKDESTSGAALYDESSATWTDIKHDFGAINKSMTTVKIKASSGKLVVTVNGVSHTFNDVSLQKWPFENYFKAGSYLISTDANTFAKVKYYSLKVSHP